MHVDLRRDSKLYHAFRSDIIDVGGRIFKIFKRYGDPNIEDRTDAIFEAQCYAYDQARSDPVLKLHIPEYFGVQFLTEIIDAHGRDISPTYNLSHCYAIEKLSGPEKKVNDPEVRENYPHVRAIRDLFEAVGIDTGDASVFCYSEPAGFKLIDFTSRLF